MRHWRDQRRAGLGLSGLLAVLFCVEACGNAEDAFTRGKSLDPCLQHIAACPGQFAVCTLNRTTYARRRFPDDSPFLFLVSAFDGDTIEVTFYFSEELDAGLDTEIWWYEPGCSDRYVYKSQGADLFEEASDTSMITRKATVLEGGDHLVEILTDMRGEVLITVDVLVPGSGG